ncbi:MAG: hypothetical protein PHS44_05760 [Candidatus Dojkabacteria bacterium]|nr:hypothetical protein [Candidatus Dojkabacteria bacterium]
MAFPDQYIVIPDQRMCMTTTNLLCNIKCITLLTELMFLETEEQPRKLKIERLSNPKVEERVERLMQHPIFGVIILEALRLPQVFGDTRSRVLKARGVKLNAYERTNLSAYSGHQRFHPFHLAYPTGEISLRGSLLHAMSDDEMYSAIIDHEGNVDISLFPDGDFFLDIDPRLAPILCRMYEKAFAHIPDIKVELKRGGVFQFGPRIEIHQGEQKVADVTFLPKVVQRTDTIRQDVGLEQLGETNIERFQYSTKTLQEAQVARFRMDGGNPAFIGLYGFPIDDPKKLATNPTSIYVPDIIKKLTEGAKTYFDIRAAAVLAYYSIRDYFRAQVKMAEFRVKLPEETLYMKKEPLITLDRMSRAGEIPFPPLRAQQIIGALRLYAGSLVSRALTASPVEVLGRLTQEPFLELFTRYIPPIAPHRRGKDYFYFTLLHAIGWDTEYERYTAFDEFRDALGFEPTTMVEATLRQAGEIIQQIQPASFDETMVVLMCLFGIHDERLLYTAISNVIPPITPSDKETIARKRWYSGWRGHGRIEDNHFSYVATELATSIAARINPFIASELYDTTAQAVQTQRRHLLAACGINIPLTTSYSQIEDQRTQQLFILSGTVQMPSLLYKNPEAASKVAETIIEEIEIARDRRQ